MSTAQVGELISFAQDEDMITTATITTKENDTISNEKQEPTMPLSIPTMEASNKVEPLRSPQRRPLGAHSRSYSWVAPKNNLSLSFPISIASPTSTFVRMPQSASSLSPLSPFSAPISNLDLIEPATNPEQFLTVLASQERRVLELREEMTRADAELEKLKRKWALHEATKKRSEARSPTHPRGTRKSEDLTSLRGGRVATSGTGISGNTKRTTFTSNTRHQRTLSLLSPDRNLSLSFPQPSDIWDENTKAEDQLAKTRPVNYFESGYERSTQFDQDRKRAGHQEALIATGKQMAEDFKEGLWTFIEDLRQATVGEDGMGPDGQKLVAHTTTVNGTPVKKKTSKSALRVSTTTTSKSAQGVKSTTKSVKPSRKSSVKATKLIDIGDDFWNELDPNGPLSAKKEEAPDFFADEPRSTKKSHNRPESIRWSSSTILSDMGSGAMSPVDTNISTPRTSTSSFSRSNSPIRKLSLDINEHMETQRSTKELLQSLADSNGPNSWGAVVTPLSMNLKRTATALLSQVEKSLAPPGTPYDIQKSSNNNINNYSKSKHH